MKKILSIICSLFIVFSSLMSDIGFAMDPPKKSSNCQVEKNNEISDDIDLVYTYVDLHDEKLQKKRNSLHQKDYDNDELKYSLRSVIQNIPWIRKIFIIMPNEKVKFLKDISEINDKIVYIKDEDILGFDSASSIAFEFNLWKLKKFGCSENILYLNYDWFIGKPVKKSKFFYYDDNGKLVPYVLFDQKIDYGQFQKIKDYYLKLEKSAKGYQTSSLFRLSRMRAFLFLYKHFNRDILCPAENLKYFPHNALGENLSELKELYDLVSNNYENANDCLLAKVRNKNDLQHQTLLGFYLINKYNRKVRGGAGAYVDLAQVSGYHFNDDLYCINTGGNRHYTPLNYLKCRVKMEQLFPKRTQYEIPDFEDGIYTISSKLDSNKRLAIKGGSKNNCANLQLLDRNGTDAQKFKVQYNPDRCYTIKAICSGKMLDVLGGSKNVLQCTKNKRNTQKWFIVPDGEGYYCLVPKCNDLCMDVCGAKATNGANIHCWSIHAGDNQRFKLEKCEDKPSSGSKTCG